jgi:uncharacterized protein YjbI with pentapeptide repeats
LSPERRATPKGEVVRFLVDARLIDDFFFPIRPPVVLNDADLQEVDLMHADLRQANLSGADLATQTRGSRRRCTRA